MCVCGRNVNTSLFVNMLFIYEVYIFLHNKYVVFYSKIRSHSEKEVEKSCQEVCAASSVENYLNTIWAINFI